MILLDFAASSETFGDMVASVAETTAELDDPSVARDRVSLFLTGVDDFFLLVFILLLLFCFASSGINLSKPLSLNICSFLAILSSLWRSSAVKDVDQG